MHPDQLERREERFAITKLEMELNLPINISAKMNLGIDHGCIMWKHCSAGRGKSQELFRGQGKKGTSNSHSLHYSIDKSN